MIPISLAVVIAATAIPLMRLQDGGIQSESDSAVTVEMAEMNETVKEYAVFQIVVDADDTYISEEIQNACIEIGNKNGYCPELLMAIIESESSGQQYAENGSCKGLMQINMSNSDVVEYMESQGYTDIYDIRTNIEMGCYVLDQKREIFDDDIYAVLMSYNGSKNVGERIDNEDYTDYAVRIVERSWELERIHGK
jgi:soluble lytic murein transglycosylase-like protein